MSISAFIRGLSRAELLQLCDTYQVGLDNLPVAGIRVALSKFFERQPELITLVMASKAGDEEEFLEAEEEVKVPKVVTENPAGGSGSSFDREILLTSLLRDLVQKPDSPLREVVGECLRRKISFGDSQRDDPGRYLVQLDRMCKNFGVTENSKLKVVARTLVGGAELWYAQQSFESYEQFIESFKKAYISETYDLKIRRQIQNRIQGKGEALQDMVAELLDLNSRLRVPLSATDLLGAVRGGVRPEVWRQVLSRGLRVDSFEDLLAVDRDCRAADEYEELYEATAAKSCKVRSSASKEIIRKEKPNFQAEPVTARHPTPTGKKGSDVRLCWNCDKPGHSWTRCRQPRKRTFCYKCGRKDVKSTECPIHKSKDTENANTSKNE